MVRQTFLSGLLIILSLMSCSVFAADISVYVNRDNISVNESFNLIFEAESTPDDEPDFSPLSVYFDILSQSQSSNMSIINGSFSRKKVWTLALLAKQPGNYAIPSIEFGNDKSPLLNIKVSKSTATQSTSDSNLFLEAEVDHQSTYVQTQILYTVKVFRSVEIQNASLTEPKLSAADAIIEKLGDDKRYQTSRNGVRFIVIERRYAIFPQQSGQLTIAPVEFNGQIVSQRRSFYDISPFNGTSKRIQSKAIEIDVKPVAAAFKNKHWLPSTEIKLVDEWPEQARFKVGEPVTRTLSLLAAGLTAAQLPELSKQDIAGIKQYPDQPTLNDQKNENGITGIRQEKIAYIPTQAGSLTLPEINIPWWNIKTGRLEYARIEAKKITVEAGSASQPSVALPPAAKAQASTKTVVDNDATSVWFYISLFLLAGWLISLFYLLPKRSRSVQQPVSKPVMPIKPSAKNIGRKFASACQQNQPELCKTLLLEWAASQWPDANINSLSELSLYVDDDLSQQIARLNQQLYAPTANEWRAADLLSAFQSNKGKPVKSNSDSQSVLKPISKIV
ncbi:MAG: BatD family protein [Gammaproteobacteria bacterium]|nr:BatD family protein [Gammaproteobacteria bacterium]